MVLEEIYLEVANANDSIDIVISDGCKLGHFFLVAKGKKKLMEKACAFYKSCIVKEYNMGKFEAFYQANDKLFPTEVEARLISIGQGIGYLYHWVGVLPNIVIGEISSLCYFYIGNIMGSTP